MIDSKKCKRVSQLGILDGGPVYVLPIVPPYDKRTEYRSKTYSVVVRSRRFDGSTVVEEKQLPYEITPEYVTSFAVGADYRRDVVGAVANGRKRVNLGDITDMQRLAALDTDSLNRLSAHLSALQAARAQHASETVAAPSVGAPVSAPVAQNEVKNG